MPISVRCRCGRGYRIPEEHAGKKFACKSCGDILDVPFQDEADDWGVAGDEYDYETASPPPRRRTRTASRSKRSRRSGMPPAVIIALVGESILIPINLLSILGNLMTANIPAMIVCAVRIAFEVACIIGFTRRERQARWASIVLSAIGLVFFGIVTMMLIANARIFANIPGAVRTLSIVLALVQMGIFGGLIGTLLTPAAGEYLDRGRG